MNKDKFYIPQIEDEDSQGQENSSSNARLEEFVSPIHGRNVKNATYYQSVNYGTNGRQYDSFRDEKDRVAKETYKGFYMKNTYSPQNEPVDSLEFPTTKIEITSKEASIITPPEEDVYTNSYVEEEYEEESSEEYIINNFEEPSEEKEVIVEQPKNVVLEATEQKPILREYVKKSKYVAPSTNLLRRKSANEVGNDNGRKRQEQIINQTLDEFSVGGHVVRSTKGPTVTLFEVELQPGVKYQRVTQLQDNLQGNLEAVSLRIQAPIPGKKTVGIEVPNIERETVFFGDMMANKEFLNDGNPLNVVLGLDIEGKPIYLNIINMPHGLIAGTTGSGKSVCINGIISSIIYKANPRDVKLILIDPKRVEFAKFNGIPHLATPIVTESKYAVGCLRWAVQEMENRYELFQTYGVSKYSEYIEIEMKEKDIKHIPYIVIIIDELADLMQTSGNDVEESIQRLTQKARAAGIHLIVATQRPSADVISGTIKNNIPTAIAFKVGNYVNSQIIIGKPGAEKLLGLGDMLYIDEMSVERRIQGAFISTTEIRECVNYIKERYDVDYIFTAEDVKPKVTGEENSAIDDPLFEEIARYVVFNQTASMNTLTKIFRCGFNRIQAIISQLELMGVVSENMGSRARDVLVTPDEIEDILSSYK